MLAMRKEAADELAQALGWERDFATGYLDGHSYRSSSTTPPKDLMSDNTNYALGVQIGYRYGSEYLQWADASCQMSVILDS